MTSSAETNIFMIIAINIKAVIELFNVDCMDAN